MSQSRITERDLDILLSVLIDHVERDKDIARFLDVPETVGNISPITLQHDSAGWRLRVGHGGYLPVYPYNGTLGKTKSEAYDSLTQVLSTLRVCSAAMEAARNYEPSA